MVAIHIFGFTQYVLYNDIDHHFKTSVNFLEHMHKKLDGYK